VSPGIFPRFKSIGRGSADPVWSEKQIAAGAAEEVGDPALRQVMRTIVQHVAALTEAAQIAQSVVGRIVIQVRGGEHDARRPHPPRLFEVGPSGDAATAIAPRLACWIEPPSVRQAAHRAAMRPAACLAYAAGALKADTSAEMGPMRGIQAAQLSSDRHDILYV